MYQGYKDGYHSDSDHLESVQEVLFDHYFEPSEAKLLMLVRALLAKYPDENPNNIDYFDARLGKAFRVERVLQSASRCLSRFSLDQLSQLSAEDFAFACCAKPVLAILARKQGDPYRPRPFEDDYGAQQLVEFRDKYVSGYRLKNGLLVSPSKPRALETSFEPSPPKPQGCLAAIFRCFFGAPAASEPSVHTPLLPKR